MVLILRGEFESGPYRGDAWMISKLSCLSSYRLVLHGQELATAENWRDLFDVIDFLEERK